MIKKLFLFSFVAFLVLVPVLAHGAVFKTGESYYLEAGSVINDNLYTAGGSVNVSGTVNGDVLATGGNLFISGPVLGDIEAAGGSVNIMSSVAGDVRVAGGNIVIANSVGGDLVVVGGQISVVPGSTAGKDLKIAGGNIDYSGETKGSASIKGGTVYFNGTVEGDLLIEAEKVKLGPNAVVLGNFDYYSPSQTIISQEVRIDGETNFHKTEIPTKETSKGAFVGFMSLVWIIKSLMIFVAALIIFYVFKHQATDIVSKSVTSFWKEVLRGFVVMVVVPVAVILSFFTVVGAFIGIIAVLFYAMLLFVGAVVSVLVFAKLALKYLFKKPDYKLNWWIILCSVIVLALIGMVPFAGWIFTFVIFLSAFGSTTNYIYNKIKS